MGRSSSAPSGPQGDARGADALRIGVRCELQGPCVKGGEPWARFLSLAVLVSDLAPPSVQVSAPGGALRGTVDVTIGARDEGGGVYARTLTAGGRTLADDRLCQTLPPAVGAHRHVTRRVPCALDAAATVRVDTRTLADGPHALRAEVEDIAGNARSASAPIVVDNLPPQPGSVALTGDPSEALTAWPSGFAGEGVTYDYRWERCGDAGCAEIGGAVSRTYQARAGDAGHRLRAVVAASDGGGTVRVASEPSGLVPAPAVAPASGAVPPRSRLTAWLERGRRRLRRATVTWPARVRIRGRLTDLNGRPLGRTPVRVLERIDGRRRRSMTGVRTRRDGRLTTFSRIGPSRQIRLVHGGAAVTLRLRVRAAVRLRVRRAGRITHVTGRVLGGPRPARRSARAAPVARVRRLADARAAPHRRPRALLSLGSRARGRAAPRRRPGAARLPVRARGVAPVSDALERVAEAPMSEALDGLAGALRERMLAEPGDGQPADARIRSFVDREAAVLDEASRAALAARIAERSFGLGPLEPLLADPEVDEVLVCGTAPAWIERHGRLEPTEARFASDADLRHAIERILAPLGRRVDEAEPLCDARLPDGSRVNVVVPPLALDGPVLTIRRFRRRGFTPEELVANGTLTAPLAELLARAVRRRCNLLVCGGTGSGKTTLLNALSSFIDPGERVVTIEDAAELRLLQPHVLRLEARPPNLEGRGEVTIRRLVRNALRMRPDRDRRRRGPRPGGARHADRALDRPRRVAVHAARRHGRRGAPPARDAGADGRRRPAARGDPRAGRRRDRPRRVPGAGSRRQPPGDERRRGGARGRRPGGTRDLHAPLEPPDVARAARRGAGGPARARVSRAMRLVPLDVVRDLAVAR